MFSDDGELAYSMASCDSKHKSPREATQAKTAESMFQMSKSSKTLRNNFIQNVSRIVGSGSDDL